MLLYKYYDYDTGIKVIKGNNIAFSRTLHFNDPLETSAALSGEHNLNEYIHLLSYDERCVVFCLTRSPLNPLMWSHYGNSHKGFVIGFNLNDTLFTSLEPEINVIPVQCGDVVYTATKPTTNIFTDKNLSQFDTLKRIFLFKSTEWAYEEEVRIVKALYKNNDTDKIKDEFERLQPTNKQKEQNNFEIPEKWLLKLPLSSIKEIHIGLNNSILHKPLLQDEFKQTLLKAKIHIPDVKIYKCKTDKTSWNLEKEAYDIKI